MKSLRGGRTVAMLIAVSQPGWAHAFERIQDGISVHAEARTTEQMRAFYIARGFSEAALDAIAPACFVTIGLRHRRAGDTVWLEPARWTYLGHDGRPATRIDRATWNQRFEADGVPRADRATFGWTQLPESRDLKPGEPVGGNVTLEASGHVTVIARFQTGSDRQGPEITIRIERIHCETTR